MKLKFNGFLVLLVVLMAQLTFAQERSVSGIVSDNAGMPLPGVSVLIKGTKTGTQSDFDGKYTIKAAPSDVLVFSYVGMRSSEKSASSTNVNVKLSSDATQLENVVVTALGIKKQKKSLGYATVTVSGKDLTEVINTNVFGSLSGKLAGVDVSAPAQVGASTKVVIRGFSSLTGNGPLYVIDGTPINNSGNGTNGTTSSRRTFDAGNGISDLDPNNIESMTVLKGAAATALYGSRAAGGAIIVTTKTAKLNSGIKVEFSTSVELAEVARVPHLQYKFGQGWDGLGYSGLATHGVASAENGSWGPAFNNEVRPWGAIVDNSQQLKSYKALNNNIKDFYDTGFTTTNNIRVAGGNETSTFSLGFSNVDSDGIVPTDSDSYLRRNLNFSGGIKGDKFDVKINFNYVKKDQKVVNTGSGDDSGEGATLVQELYQIPSDISVIDLKDYKNNPFNTPSNYFSPYTSNPYFLLNENSTKIKGNRIFGNTNFTYKITPKLTALYQIGGDYRNEKIKSYGAVVRFEPGSAQDINHTIATVGGVTESTTERTELDQYLNFNYASKINDDFKINVMLGAASNERATDFLEGQITQLDLPNYYELSNSASKPILTQSNSLRRNYGVYTSIETSYLDKIFFTVTGRNDWSSTLPVKNNSYFYPSASLSGIVIDNNETFLKLRGGWAKVAKDTDPYQTESSYIQAIAGANFGNINFPIGGVNAYEFATTLGNNELKPETTTEIELGFETSLFSKRVNLDLALYNKKTTDLLYLRDVAPSTGFTRQTGNILDVTNKGIEIALNTTPLQTENFSWNLNGTFTKNLSNVDKVYGDSNTIELTNSRNVTFNAVEGRPLGIYMSKTPQMVGDKYIVNPATGYYVPSTEQQEIGTSQRDFVIGIQNKFNYKNFTLSFGFDWKQGGEMFSESKYLAYFTGNGIETTYNDRNGFILPNSVNEVNTGGVITYVENTTEITAFPASGTSNGRVTPFYSSVGNQTIVKDFIFDKTFVRMRDLSLTFNVPMKIAKQIGLTNASIAVYGKNLFLWTPDANPYLDPEITTFGDGVKSEFGESYGSPSQRSYGTSIKLTF
ncbi:MULTISPECIES: SusC/RagA family TonB-linked outer membrane protein [Flavobacterium]|uniref:SusC/RagA family TonB-linked outer membrane protein n=1 Tax=Flavobacterium TaxID=237 RepID=UPI002481A3DD|nr:MULTISPECIES: SusC/RagA family TonB-linked outer membrane protein [Flavobacterium]